NLIRMTIRRPRPIPQPFRPFQPIALHPLVAGLPAYPVAPAQFRHAPFLVLKLLDKFESLFHCACLFPSHNSWMNRGIESVTHAPGSNCTYAPGLYSYVGQALSPATEPIG